MATTVTSPDTAVWRDGKRYLWLIGLVVPSLAFVAFAGRALTGWSWWLWLGPIIILGVIPAVDLLVGRDRTNPPEEAVKALEADPYYRWIVYAYVPIQYLGFAAAMYLVIRGNPVPDVLDALGLGGWLDLLPGQLGTPFELSVIERIGASISIGCVGGIAINTAHELGHKRPRHERWLSKVALAQSGYGHFYIEHNRGHHVRVATPEDPASSRLGESFYAFWPRTVFGSLRSAWRLESSRLRRRGKPVLHPGNDVLNAWAMTLVLWGAMMLWLGIGVLPYLLLQGVVGLSLLEVVNYLEHYGMRRAKVHHRDVERYERVLQSHSWNSNNIATNVFLYHLQRHSDHHANPTRRYQALRDHESAPVLPTGYAGMIVLALLPPLWRRVMDPRVAAHFDGDLTRANIDPRKRDRILVTHAAGARALAPALTAPAAQAPDEVASAACPGCGYEYLVAAGDEHEGFPAGTPWSEIPVDWACPDCGVRDKLDFVVRSA
ncbi:alkane 1-monooxygenase [Janibacter limosus]|uniref:Alkane 1-monooxygenase n=1 Tax=Janibacter limosus TaxID=53458 RepID=A0A4P6MXT5_9MICO|nr:alkane 1-monooxygenase [Janibacter limosus]